MSPGGGDTYLLVFCSPGRAEAALVPSQLNRVDAHVSVVRPGAGQGAALCSTSTHTMKSLILAQDERWRRA